MKFVWRTGSNSTEAVGKGDLLPVSTALPYTRADVATVCPYGAVWTLFTFRCIKGGYDSCSENSVERSLSSSLTVAILGTRPAW